MRKLRLTRSTVRRLSGEELRTAQGGEDVQTGPPEPSGCSYCNEMSCKDTGYCPTYRCPSYDSPTCHPWCQ